MKIAIVNDVSAIITILGSFLEKNTKHQIVWSAADGAEAVDKCERERPDLILMDLIMPVMDGVEATRRIMDRTPCAILVVTASVTGNASKVFEAMGAGALDAINTPSLDTDGRRGTMDGLLRKIDTIGRLISRSESPPEPTPTPPTPDTERSAPLIAIGSSTGGPAALATILSALPAGFDASIVIIQHVDSEFAPGLAQWLNDQTPLPVRLAQSGDTPSPGQVLVAGTCDHLVLGTNQRLDYSADPKDYVYRPSVNVFFESVTENWHYPAVGVLLTGMGRDGAAGLLTLRRRGMFTIAQDMETCAVYGMPKAAVEMGAAAAVLPIEEIASNLIRIARDRRGNTTKAGAAQ